MKLFVQVLLHSLGAIAGFWIASEHAVKPAEKPVLAVVKFLPKTANTPALFKTPPKAASEAGIALLTPDSWAEAMNPISQLSSAELPVVLRGLLRNPYPEVKRRLLHCLFERWATLDLTSAVVAMKRITSPQHRETALRAVLRTWNKADASAAWEWVTAQNDDPVLQESGLDVLLGENAATDPLQYAAWADQLEDVFLREKALERIARSWITSDPQAALAAVLTVEPARLRELLLSQLPYKNGVDHVAGLEVVAQLPSQANRSRLNDEWLSGYASVKPQEALQWLQQQAALPEMQKAADTLGGIWARRVKNITDLRAEALKLPAGPVRDAFAARAAGEWADTGHSIKEAQDLLSLCGPCLERDRAQSTIDSKRTKP